VSGRFKIFERGSQTLLATLLLLKIIEGTSYKDLTPPKTSKAQFSFKFFYKYK
jgi:hypothetical protein